MSNRYLERYEFSQPGLDAREAEFKPVLENGVPMHDLRAVDMVEEALLDPRWGYRTAKGIERSVFVLPHSLIASILEVTPCIARLTPLRKNGEDAYAHREKPKSAAEKYEAVRRVLAKDY